MAPRGSKAAKVKEPPPYADYLDKEPTDLQDHLTGWLLDKTGFEPENPDDFAEGVRLCVALRMTHQASPENAERRAASEERSAVKAAQAAKAKAAEEDEDPAPKRRGRPPKAKAVEEDETPAPKRRGRPPKVKPTEEVEAPKANRKPPVKGRAKPPAEDF